MRRSTELYAIVVRSRFCALKLSCAALFLYSLFFVQVFVLLGCTRRSDEQDSWQLAKAFRNKDSSEVFFYCDRIQQSSEDLSLKRKTAEECGEYAFIEKKDFKRALGYFRQVVLIARDFKLAQKAQEKIAEIEFDHLQDYQQAVIELTRLDEHDLPRDQKLKVKLQIGRCYYYLNNFVQALVELQAFFKLNPEPDSNWMYEGLELRANILLQSKRYDDAITEFRNLIKRFPNLSRERQVGLMLALSFEEKKDLAGAIETLKELEKTYPNKEFIEQSLRRLRQQQMLLPGAQGLHK